ncbi:MAG TPA: hypothetical protein PK444_11510 [Syntrophorhabdaceae bacterium]|nr:hypothetical protein [Syntrophorhabdaceae bacterium]
MDNEYTKSRAIQLLKTEGEGLDALYQEADLIRRRFMGDDVYIRGIVEFSNICLNVCLYSGIRASNKNVRRYMMKADEILEVSSAMINSQQTTIVLQSGEAPWIKDKELGELIMRIKKTDLPDCYSIGRQPAL